MRLTVYFPEDSPATHTLLDGTWRVGRLTDNDIQIDDGSVSSHHAEILVQDGAAWLRDGGSTNGTFVNGEQVAEHTLQPGDEIHFGSVRTTFAASPEAGPEEELAAPTELPEFAPTSVAAGLPANFQYMSPMPKPQVPRDTLGLAAWGLSGLAVAAGLYALFAILSA